MSSEDWYRNTSWDDEIAAAFNARLARSRSQKAQYLRIQGSILKDNHPAVAIQLLRRCIEEGVEFHIAHALFDIAHAHYVMGEVDRALQMLEATMDQQARVPMVRTSAAYDYAMLVALHDDVARFDRALAALEGADDPLFPSMVFQAEAARAVIYASRGQDALARRAARNALAAQQERSGWIPGHPKVGVAPVGDDPLSQRVRALARMELH